MGKGGSADERSRAFRFFFFGIEERVGRPLEEKPKRVFFFFPSLCCLTLPSFLALFPPPRQLLYSAS